ncbi:hypothetical protein RB195_021409 [Necator americanus]|uniref:Uncharacterized protein n=1 Tax=Necator americanus TaxID=51031 RepID=A0ABR1EAV9_NECAM
MSELVPVDEKLFARILHCPSCGHEYHEQLSNIALDESTDSESPKRRRMTDPASLVCPKCNVTIKEEKSDDVNTRMEAGMAGPLSGDHHTTKASQEDICGNRPREAKPEKPNKMHEDDGGLIIDVENVTPSPPDRLIIANSPTADSKNSIPSETSNGSTVHVKAEVKKEASLSSDSLRDAKPSVNDKHNIPPGPCPDELQHPNDTTVEKEIKLEDDKPSPPDLLSILRNRELWSPISDDEISPNTTPMANSPFPNIQNPILGSGASSSAFIPNPLVTPLSSLPPFNVQNPALGIVPPGITNNSMNNMASTLLNLPLSPLNATPNYSLSPYSGNLLGNMTPPFPNLSVPPPPLGGIANFCPPVFANTPMENPIPRPPPMSTLQHPTLGNTLNRGFVPFTEDPSNNMTSSSVSPNIHVPQGAFTGPGIIPGTPQMNVPPNIHAPQAAVARPSAVPGTPQMNVPRNIHAPQATVARPGAVPASPQMDVPANIHGPQAAVARPAEVSGATQMDVPANIYGHQGVVARSGTVPVAPQMNVPPNIHAPQGAAVRPSTVPGTTQMNVPPNIHAPQGATVRPSAVPGTTQMNVPRNIHAPQATVARPGAVPASPQMSGPSNIHAPQSALVRSGSLPATPQRNVSPKVHGLQGAVGKPVVVPGTPQVNVPSNIHAPQGAVVRPGVVPGTPQMNMQASAPVRANPSPQSTITGSNTRTCVKNTATSPSAPQPLPKPLPKRPIVTRPAATASAPTHGHAPPPNANLSAPEYQCLQQLTGAPVMNALEKPLFAMCIKCNTEFYELKPMDFKLLFPAESIQTSSNLADLVSSLSSGDPGALQPATSTHTHTRAPSALVSDVSNVGPSSSRATQQLGRHGSAHSLLCNQDQPTSSHQEDMYRQSCEFLRSRGITPEPSPTVQGNQNTATIRRTVPSGRRSTKNIGTSGNSAK